jgi:hypothetical protein
MVELSHSLSREKIWTELNGGLCSLCTEVFIDIISLWRALAARPQWKDSASKLVSLFCQILSQMRRITDFFGRSSLSPRDKGVSLVHVV